MSKMLGLFLIAMSTTVGKSRTLDCNYVIDLFYTTANPPSKAPTATPTRSPTNSPTKPPTETGYKVSNITTTQIIWDIAEGGSGSSAEGFSIFNLIPYIPNGNCYATATNQEPLNSFSFKYECVDDALKRTIYYDNLDCTGSDQQT